MENFDWKYYFNKYPDLSNAKINNEHKCIKHYNNHGKFEGRFFSNQNEIDRKNSNIICYSHSGALGDLINLLYIVHMNFKIYEKKGNLYLKDKYFTRNFKDTYNDIYDFIISQEYINDFKIFD